MISQVTFHAKSKMRQWMVERCGTWSFSRMTKQWKFLLTNCDRRTAPGTYKDTSVVDGNILFSKGTLQLEIY